MSDRHSETDEPDLIKDPAERAFAEARNALRQFDVGMLLLDHWLDVGRPYIRPSDLLTLNRFAIAGIHKFAGTFRNSEVRIGGSQHQPPNAAFVPELVEDFCAYLNANWDSKTAEHLAAYALWRMNWIHPFADGNGRTARILSYIVLSAKSGFRLPGTTTIPEQIAANKSPYYAALEDADRAFLRGRIDVSKVEDLIEECLEKQILSAESRPATSSKSEDRRVIIDSELLDSLIPTIERSLLTVPGREKHILKIIEKNPVLFNGLFSLLSGIGGAALGAILTLTLSK
ncbi:MAG: Fic family protein [Methylorubrum populi]